MIAVDTNVLVRFLVRDDELQARLVYELLKKSEAANTSYFVPLLVVIETIWVLEYVYGISRDEIIDSLDDLILMPVWHFENQTMMTEFIMEARLCSMDLSDLLISLSAKSSNCETVITFDKKASDKKASKTKFFRLLE